MSHGQKRGDIHGQEHRLLLSFSMVRSSVILIAMQELGERHGQKVSHGQENNEGHSQEVDRSHGQGMDGSHG